MVKAFIETLADKLAVEKKLFEGLQSQLGSHLKLSGGNAEGALRLLSSRQEGGLDHVLQLLKDNPARFGLRSPPTSQATSTLTPVLVALDASARRIEELVDQRERYLRQADPTRLPVVAVFSREVMIDLAGNTQKWLDTGKVEPFQSTRYQRVEAFDKDRDQDRDHDLNRQS